MYYYACTWVLIAIFIWCILELLLFVFEGADSGSVPQEI